MKSLRDELRIEKRKRGRKKRKKVCGRASRKEKKTGAREWKNEDPLAKKKKED